MSTLDLALELCLTIAGGVIAVFAITILKLRRRLHALGLRASIVTSTDNAVIITDKARKIIWVNEAFTVHTGYRMQEALGRTPAELLQNDATSHETIEKMRYALANEIEFHGEVLNRNKAGEARWIELDIAPVRNSVGKVIGFSSIQRDITDRKMLARELEDSRRLLTGALDAYKVDIAILDAEGTILFVNEAWSAKVQNQEKHFSRFKVGSNYFDLVNANALIDREIATQAIEGIKSVLEGSCENFEFKYPIKSDRDTIWYSLNVNRFRNDPPRVVIFHEDITVSKLAQQWLLNKQENCGVFTKPPAMASCWSMPLASSIAMESR